MEGHEPGTGADELPVTEDPVEYVRRGCQEAVEIARALKEKRYSPEPPKLVEAAKRAFARRDKRLRAEQPWRRLCASLRNYWRLAGYVGAMTVKMDSIWQELGEKDRKKAERYWRLLVRSDPMAWFPLRRGS